MAVGTEVCASKTLKRTSHRPIASAPTHAIQNSASNLTGSRQRAARPTRRAGQAERDGTYPKRKKENTGRLKEEVPKKIKASISMENVKEIKTGNNNNGENPRDKPKWKDKARS
jgi:hypothetical protein